MTATPGFYAVELEDKDLADLFYSRSSSPRIYLGLLGLGKGLMEWQADQLKWRSSGCEEGAGRSFS